MQAYIRLTKEIDVTQEVDLEIGLDEIGDALTAEDALELAEQIADDNEWASFVLDPSRSSIRREIIECMSASDAREAVTKWLDDDSRPSRADYVRNVQRTPVEVPDVAAWLSSAPASEIDRVLALIQPMTRAALACQIITYACRVKEDQR